MVAEIISLKKMTFSINIPLLENISMHLFEEPTIDSRNEMEFRIFIIITNVSAKYVSNTVTGQIELY